MAYLDKSGDWGRRFAPSLAELESLARVVFSHLPKKLRLLSQAVSVHLADFPEDTLIEDMGLESPFELLSLYEGAELAARFSLPRSGGKEESRIWLFRRPILDYWAENEESLEEIISYLLMHELSRPLRLSGDDADWAAGMA